MAQSESTKQAHALDKILPAILAVQSSVEPIKKDTDNTFFKSKYADLASIWHDIKGLMKEQGLVVAHTAIRAESGADLLVTRIYHAQSGQFLESICPIDPVKKDPQGYGAAMTYMRRYALSGLLGIVTESDDDGNTASQAEKKSDWKPVKPKEAPVKPSKTFTQADYEGVLEKLAKCHDQAGLDVIAGDARAVWGTMTKTYQDLVGKAINNKKTEIKVVQS